jgi:hypothetical protein
MIHINMQRGMRRYAVAPRTATVQTLLLNSDADETSMQHDLCPQFENKGRIIRRFEFASSKAYDSNALLGADI